TPTLTPSRTPTPTPTLSDIQIASTPAAVNADWTPIEQDFDGVTMVMVPAGCFDMGSDNGVSDEKPVTEICFTAPFWLDKTEVTNGQFAQFDGEAANASRWPDADRPRENITWFEARDFCAQREARLPTEAEWEYAARGPENWVYPWGNEFVANNVVFGDNSGSQTAAAGSKPGGASWVGALDLSGNVWEWASSAYQPYPYQADDGREDSNGTDVQRVLRGGSWFNVYPSNFRAASRSRDTTDHRNNIRGFRCVRLS
ncbi:MAG TPA: formylglycine-generating enzyme family protein, partial [Phototrophicaceae bacterium]|nr:formylglycine-generating enzyme family protein [Phototrophicaceae bacterium]